MTPLKGTKVIVAGAGMAGLTAAHRLERDGADVVVIEARDRVGGRVWTIREGFEHGHHAEAGADLLEPEQTAVLDLAKELGLTTSKILRRGFGYYGPDAEGRPRMQSQKATFDRFGELLSPLVEEYTLAEHRWDGAVAARLGRTSVAEWLDGAVGHDDWLRHRFKALRGLFLADPEELSLLAVVDFFADDPAGPYGMMRIDDGNDRLATALAGRLERPPMLKTVVRRVHQVQEGARSVTVTIEARGRLVERTADVLVCALPPTTARDVVFEPALPEAQRRAIDTITFGPATRVLLQFDRRFWRRAGQPTAFGSPYPFGAVWDGNEQQDGPAGILSLLAGGGASTELQQMLAHDGTSAVVPHLGWLGRPAHLLAARTITWEQEPWARGGYAVFDTAFNPSDRDALGRPAGRVLFAGEHTSVRWQGYVNGAIESGKRAAAEVRALMKTS